MKSTEDIIAQTINSALQTLQDKYKRYLELYKIALDEKTEVDNAVRAIYQTFKNDNLMTYRRLGDSIGITGARVEQIVNKKGSEKK